MHDPLARADALADRLAVAIQRLTGTGADATPGGPVVADLRNVGALASVASTLALVSIARDIHRAVDMAAEYYFDVEDDE
jgi:hypothetical protein